MLFSLKVKVDTISTFSLFQLETFAPWGNVSQRAVFHLLEWKSPSREECSSNIFAITQPAETQVKNIRAVLALPLCYDTPSAGKLSLCKALSQFGHLFHLFLPEICPSLSIPERNVTVKGILERKCSFIYLFFKVFLNWLLLKSQPDCFSQSPVWDELDYHIHPDSRAGCC